MFFENELLSFNILDVIELRQENVNMHNSGRNFSALSLRLCADTTLTTKQNTYHLTDGCVSFVPSGLDYSRASKRDELIVVHFDVTNYRARDIEFFKPKDTEIFAKLFFEILEHWSAKKPGYKYRCSAILNEIFEECYKQNCTEKSKGSKIAASVDYMKNNFADPKLAVGDIAARSYMSEVYFRKLFKAEFGISPQKYIIDLRIQNAAALISTGYYSLKEIALACGYTDYKYFSVEFKKLKGVSPSEYMYNYSE